MVPTKLQQGHPTLLDTKVYRTINIEPGSYLTINDSDGQTEMTLANPPHNVRSVEVYLSKRNGDIEDPIEDQDLRDLKDFLNSSIIIINRIIMDRGRQFEGNNIHEIDGHLRALKEKVAWLVKKWRENEAAKKDV